MSLVLGLPYSGVLNTRREGNPVQRLEDPVHFSLTLPRFENSRNVEMTHREDTRGNSGSVIREAALPAAVQKFNRSTVQRTEAPGGAPVPMVQLFQWPVNSVEDFGCL
jgi:hypothetical protein